MTRVGLLSDTHGYLDPQLFTHFDACDEVWHAGDIGSMEVVEQLQAFRPLRAVYGNIDGYPISRDFPENQRFNIGGLNVWITHIGGSPPRYNSIIRPQLTIECPDLFICGHSHIMKVMRDPKQRNLLFINPGAAGKIGFHQLRTCLRFTIDTGRLTDVEVIELGKR